MIPLPSLSSDIAPIEAALDAVTQAERINWMRGLAKKEMVALWKLAEGRPVTKADLHGAEGQVIIHIGQNSLPAFSTFEKRVVLREGAIQGYNHQAMSWLTGPGHFTIAEDAQGAHFDYLHVAATAPPEFPPIQPNEKGLSKLVYANMIDYLRRVCDGMLIGAAFKGGKATNDYFMLVRGG